MGGNLQQFFILHDAVVDCLHLKNALCHGACFVKGNGLRGGEGFQIVGAFDQHTFTACSADTCKKAERDADHQCTGAADDEKRQCTVNPVAPHGRPSRQQKEKRG